MPAKASCEVKTRTVRQPQKNGDIYVIERKTQYDPVKKYNVVLSSRIIGKIPVKVPGTFTHCVENKLDESDLIYGQYFRKSGCC